MVLQPTSHISLIPVLILLLTLNLYIYTVYPKRFFFSLGIELLICCVHFLHAEYKGDLR